MNWGLVRGSLRGLRRPLLPSLRSLWHGPLLAQVVVTRRCNIDCGYCNEYDKTSPPVPRRTVERWIDRLAELRTISLEFTGGETLLHPELVPLVAHASHRGFLSRWIITNGFLLSPRIVQGLNDAGLTHLQISIDGVAPTQTTVKVLKVLRSKLELLAKSARFMVQVNAVLGSTNAGEAVEVARLARDLGFVPRVCVIHDERGGLRLDANTQAAMAEIQAIVGGAWSESGDYRTRLMSEGRADFKCRAGARYLYVDEFGLVNWCSQQRGVFTKPILEYGWRDLQEQFDTPKPCAPTCTVGCVRSASAFDEWRSQASASRPTRAPAANQDALIPATALRPRIALQAGRRRSQSAMRVETPART